MFGNAGLQIIVGLLIFLAAGVVGGFIGYRLMKSRQLQTRNEAEAALEAVRGCLRQLAAATQVSSRRAGR